MQRKRVVITGIGPVTPIGIGVTAFWESCLAGRSGIGPIRLSSNSHGPDISVAGQVSDFDPVEFIPKAKAKWMDRFAHLGVAAAKLAVADACLDLEDQDLRKIGVIGGSCLGGMQVAEEQLSILKTKKASRVRPKLVPATTINSLSGEISIALGLKGPNLSMSNSYVCGAEALGLAYYAFQLYDLDVMVVGGVDAPLGSLTVRSLMGVDHISNTAIRPFDLNRDGFILSEGGAALVMERLDHARQRGAEIYAEYAGYGQTRGAGARDADALLQASRQALNTAALTPESVDYVQASGAATPLGDRLETDALKVLLGPRAYRVPVSAVKSMVGHTFGGAAAIEIAVCALSLRHQQVSPTINYESPDPDCDLDYVPNQARSADLSAVLAHGVGLTGDYVATVLREAAS